MPPPSGLEISGLSKAYGRTVALRAVSLRVTPGECLGLLGANGSGKTTLLKIVAGVTPATAGTVTYLGRNLHLEPRFGRSHIGLLASETYLYDDLTARENLQFILTMSGRDGAESQIGEALRRARLEHHTSDRVRTFSSGMKRRLAIARVQMLHPQLVLLDEPYNSLDAESASDVNQWILSVLGRGGGVIVATHDAHRLMTIATHVARLERGRLSFLGSVQGYAEAHASSLD